MGGRRIEEGTILRPAAVNCGLKLGENWNKIAPPDAKM